MTKAAQEPTLEAAKRLSVTIDHHATKIQDEVGELRAELLALKSQIAALEAEPAMSALKAVKLHPYCLTHGAMLAVSKDGLYRCPECHVGWDRKTGQEITAQEADAALSKQGGQK